MIVAAFVAAAALGALLRAEAGRRWNQRDGLALGTFAVNVAGSFLLGLLSGISPAALTILGVAGIGAFTTFSSFARDAAALLECRKLGLAAAYVVGSCACGLAAAAGGLAIAG